MVIAPELHVTHDASAVPLTFPASHARQVSAEVADGVELRVFIVVLARN